MRRVVASLMLLLVAVAHAPTPAQTSEPISLVLTGLALLSLAQLGHRRTP